jgi:hypothetical protein
MALSLFHTFCSSLQLILSLLSLLCLHQSLSGNGFQWRIFPLRRFPEISPCLSCPFLRTTDHNGWTAVLWLLTNSPTKTSLPCTALHCTALTPRLTAISHQPLTFLTDYNWNELNSVGESYGLGADPQRTPLAAPLLLLRDVTAYVTRSSAACVWALT